MADAADIYVKRVGDITTGDQMSFCGLHLCCADSGFLPIWL